MAVSSTPVFRRKMRKTVDYWEYFQVEEKRLQYLEGDGDEPKKVVLSGIASYEVLESWDVVKDPERALVLDHRVVNIEEI
jgi:hypothetical protein